MLGIANTELAWAYILCILASLLCVVYGIVKWNDAGVYSDELRDLDDDTPQNDRA